MPGPEDTARFKSNVLRDKTISLDVPQVIHKLFFSDWGDFNIFTIGTEEDVKAGNTLTLVDVSRGSNTPSFDQYIRANIILSDDSTCDIDKGYNVAYGIAVNGIISGEGKSLTKTGVGPLTLCGANTYSGVTTISEGTLKLGNDSSLTGSVAGDIVNNGTLIVSSPGDVILGNISGTGNIVKQGRGTLTLSGNSCAASSGKFTIKSYVWNVYTAGALDCTVPGTALDNSSHSWEESFSYIGTESLDIGTGSVSLSKDLTVNVLNNTLSVGGAISGSAKLTKGGGGTLELKAQNTYSGGTVINAGKITLAEEGGLSSSVTINSDATLVLDNSIEITNRLSDAASVTLAGKIELTGNDAETTSETAGTLTHAAGSITATLSPGEGQHVELKFASLGGRNAGASGLYRGSSLGSAPGNDTANIFFTASAPVSSYGAFAAIDEVGAAATTGAAVLRGIIFDDSENGSGKGFAAYDAPGYGVRMLDKNTEQMTSFVPGTANIRLDLNSDESFTGECNTLHLDNISGDVRYVTNSGDQLCPHNGLLFTGSDLIVLEGGKVNANLDESNGEAIILSANSAGVTVDTEIIGNNITIGGSGDFDLNGTLTAAPSGAGYIRLNTSGTVSLSAAANGALVVNDATLKLMPGGKLYEANSEASGSICYVTVSRLGTLDLNGVSAKSNGIHGSGKITNNSETPATLTCEWRPSGKNWQSFKPNFSGNIEGNIKLYITGSGYYIYNYIQELGGNNTFNGGVTVGNANFTLKINSPAALGTGPLTINGGNLDSESLVLSTNNEQIWNNSFTFKGSGSLNMGAGSVTLGTENPTVTVAKNNLVVEGPIGEEESGSGFTKAGAGKLILESADSTYTGNTIVNEGALEVNGVLGSGDIFVKDGGKLILNANETINDRATLSIEENGVAVLNNTAPELIKALVIGGVEQFAGGTYGAPGSGAAHQIEDYFEGKGQVCFIGQTFIMIR